MRNGIIYKSDGEKLIEIYRLFNVNGSLKRKLSAEEMVLIYAMGNVLKEKAVEDKTDTNTFGKWILCSERMPENMNDVLVCFEYFRYGEYNKLCQRIGIGFAHNGKWSGVINGSSGWRGLRIIAWMPLPEPYREEK